MGLRVKTSPRFKRKFKRIANKNVRLARKADKKLQQLINDPSDARLKIHKLSGFDEPTWSFSVDYKTRIIFVFGNEELLLMDIGSHDEVY